MKLCTVCGSTENGNVKECSNCGNTNLRTITEASYGGGNSQVSINLMNLKENI